ncbi:TPA: hypothetical protein ACUB6L_004037 [Raoultella ornithinolytica]
MTTDITELAQMKGQKVEGSYYLAECTDCGKMYPSNKLNGGEPLFSGDYGECYCPHCNADDAAIGDCGDTAAIAWNYQQGRIDALVEALEKAQTKAIEQGRTACELFDEVTALRQRIAELESRTVTIEPFRSFVTDADLTALYRFAECCDDPESGGHDLEKEQVQRLEAIGALQRSGRISYITGFGDVLISITAGIKVGG